MFYLTGRFAVITGGAGLLGRGHAGVLARAGASVVLVDLDAARIAAAAKEIAASTGARVEGFGADISSADAVRRLASDVLAAVGPVDILINNAANNPRVEPGGQAAFSRFETFSLAQWQDDVAVGLTGAFLCSQAFGPGMAERGRGVIVNVASDLAVIAPDQRLYRQPGVADASQPVKPVTYSVVKTGLIGLTRYLSTYWADRGVRVNAISPGGVENGQPAEFLSKISALIPLGRMARPDEYEGAILFLCSDASSYMTGANLVIDGGRSTW
jgi:NAD(P)-dependent dehydrogenase (short-subunit alcohol dehydrogenase family)